MDQACRQFGKKSLSSNREQIVNSVHEDVTMLTGLFDIMSG
jgi:hypothetical protein